MSAVIEAGEQVHDSVPTDLRQVYERFCRAVSECRSAQSNAPLTSAWHLTTLPLAIKGVIVGAVVAAGRLDVPVQAFDSAGSSTSVHVKAATAARMSVVASLAEEFFGPPMALACAQHVRRCVLHEIYMPARVCPTGA